MAESVDTIIVRIKAEGTQDFIKQLKDAGVQTEVETKKIKKSTEGLGKSFKKLGGLVAGVFALGAIKRFAQASVGAFAGFNQQLQQLSAITGLVGTDLERLEGSAKKLALGSRQSSTDVLNAFKLIGSAKPELLQNVDALEELTEASIVLSEASGLTLPESATALGNSLNALQLPASEAGNLINILASASQKGAKEIPFVTEALSKFGGISAQAGLEVSESVSAIETLGKAIPEASIVGTNLRNILIKLQVESAKSGKEFTSLADSLDDLAPFQKDVTKLTEEFGDRNLLAIQTLISQRAELRELQSVIDDTNTAYEQQAVQSEGAQAQLDKLNNAFKEFRISLGQLIFNALQPVIASLTGFLVKLADLPKFLKDNRTEIRLLAVALLGLKLGAITTQIGVLRKAFIAWRVSATATAGSITAVGTAVKVLTSATGIGLLITLASTLALVFSRVAKNAKKSAEDIVDVNEALEDTVSLQQKLFTDLALGDQFSADDLENFRESIKSLSEEDLEFGLQVLIGELRKASKVVAELKENIEEGVDGSGFEEVRLSVAELQVEDFTDKIALIEEAIERFKPPEIDTTPSSNSLKALSEELKKINETISTTDPDSQLFDKLNKDAFALEERIKIITDEIERLRGNKKVVEAIKKIDEQLEKFKKENVDAQLEADAREISKIEEKYQKLIDEAKEFGREFGDIEEQRQIAVNAKQDEFLKRDLKDYTDFADSIIAEAQRLALAEAEIRSGTPADPLGKKVSNISEEIDLSKVDDAEKERLKKLDEFFKAGRDRGGADVISDEEFQRQKTEITEQAEQERQIIRDKYRKEEADKEQEFLDEQQEARLASASERVGQIQEGATALFDFFRETNDLQQKLLEDRLAKGLISQEEFDKKTAELKAKQARQDKAQAIFNIGLDTAQAIIKVFASLPTPAAIVASALVGALGLAQLQAVLQTPIPQFAKGTKGKRKAPAGMAWVGEEGAELIQMKGGEKVITNQDSEELMKILGSYSIPVQFQSTEDRMNKKINLKSIGMSSTGSLDISPMLQATDRQSRVLSKKLDRLNNHFERVNFGRMITKN